MPISITLPKPQSSFEIELAMRPLAYFHWQLAHYDALGRSVQYFQGIFREQLDYPRLKFDTALPCLFTVQVIGQSTLAQRTPAFTMELYFFQDNIVQQTCTFYGTADRNGIISLDVELMAQAVQL